MTFSILGERLVYIIAFPALILAMLYLSALLGMKWQGAWLRSSLCALLQKGPRPLRLVLATLAGAVTPFCSCTTVPGFAAILEFKLGLDTAMAFLMASPLIDPAGTVLLFLLFGAKITVIYLLISFLGAIAGGWIMGRLFSEKDVNPILFLACSSGEDNVTWGQAAQRACHYIKGFWWVVIASTLVGILLYDYIPARLVESFSQGAGLFAIPLASILGVAVYAHMAVLFPAGAALLAKGMTPGIVLAFLASSAGVSPPEIILLRRIISLRSLVFYICYTVIMITIIGFAANLAGR